MSDYRRTYYMQTDDVTLVVDATDEVEGLRKSVDDLKRVLRDVLTDGAVPCSPYEQPCSCSTARAQRLLNGEPEWPTQSTPK